ncbi:MULTISPECIES: GNAT family N-acetyltransferase [Vibrio]|uniref:GNAT family N-acetyltransferase n=1 Tax=Vibrio TaxID=662 RepID=UPI003D0DB451
MMETERLILRQWQASDLHPYAIMTADPLVMRFFPALLSTEESHAQANRARALIENNGWGFWAVELKGSGQFIGFVGLHSQNAESGFPFAPMVEIGWRLRADAWGKGYAPEAAMAALTYAFETLKLPCVYSFTTLANEPSKRVMQKIGMRNTGHTFSHPHLSTDHALSPHCLYQITRAEFLKLTNG